MFYVLAFSISWSGMIPQALASHGILGADSFIFSFLGVGGPALAAFITHAVAEGKNWLRRSLQPVIRWRVGGIWYAAAFGLPVIFYALAIAMDLLMGGNVLSLENISPAFLASAILLQHLLTNVWEEIGWRAYALEMHQRRLNALASTIIVTVLSGLWHLPLFFTANYPMVVVPYIVWLLEHSAAAAWLLSGIRGDNDCCNTRHMAGWCGKPALSGC
jgi:membrane protease YdiL (CAAX protease family)